MAEIRLAYTMTSKIVKTPPTTTAVARLPVKYQQ